MTNREKLKQLMEEYEIIGDVEDFVYATVSFLKYLEEKTQQENPELETRINRYSRVAFDLKFSLDEDEESD